jgi:DNA-binding NarL/FixJ family response regulator
MDPEGSRPISVLVATGLALVNAIVARALNEAPDVAAAGVAFGDELADALSAPTVPIDVVLVEVDEIGGEWGAAVSLIQRRTPTPVIVVLLAPRDVAAIATVSTRAVLGYVLVSRTVAELLRAIRTVHGGEAFVDERLRSVLPDEVLAAVEEEAVRRRR